MRTLGECKEGDIETWFDSYGLIPQKNGDCGDPNTTFLYFILAYFQEPEKFEHNKERIKKLIASIQVKPGVWIRHPEDGTDWHKDPKEFSRDQWVGLVTMLGLYGFNKELVNTGTTFQNKDINPPLSQWRALFHRVCGRKVWQISWGDFFLYLNVLSLLKNIGSDYDNVGDDKNIIIMFLACEVFGHTTWSKRAMEHYKNNRPSFRKLINVPSRDLSVGSNGALYAMKHYYRKDEPSGPPPLGEYGEPTLQKFFKRS